MTRTHETGHPVEIPGHSAKNPDTGHRARVRPSGHVRCPAEPSTMSGRPGPSDALFVLLRMHANYQKRGKFMEAKAIQSAIREIRKDEKQSWLTELELTQASQAQSLSWPEIKWPPLN